MFRNDINERTLERKLAMAVKSSGGMALKFTSPGMAGVPDRLLLFPGGRMAFAEIKAPGKKPRPLQLAVHRRLSGLGFKVFVLDGMDQIPTIIREAVA